MMKKIVKVTEVRYECDLLGTSLREGEWDEVHCVFHDDMVISREAVARLPEWFSGGTEEQSKTRLHNLLRAVMSSRRNAMAPGIPTESAGWTTPEELHRGIWVFDWSLDGVYAAIWNFHGSDRKRLIETYGDAVAEIQRYVKARHCYVIFQNGRHVSTHRAEQSIVLVQTEASDEIRRPQTLGQMQDEVKTLMGVRVY